MANTAPGNTGNALTDASTGLAVDPQAAATAINTANQQAAQVASDCLWPPSGQFTVPIIPGLLHQSVSLPCLFTYSEGRALVGASLVAAGLGVIFFVGVPLLVTVAAFDLGIGAIKLVTGSGGKGGGAAAGGAAAAGEGAAVPAVVAA